MHGGDIRRRMGRVRMGDKAAVVFLRQNIKETYPDSRIHVSTNLNETSCEHEFGLGSKKKANVILLIAVVISSSR